MTDREFIHSIIIFRIKRGFADLYAKESDFSGIVEIVSTGIKGNWVCLDPFDETNLFKPCSFHDALYI